MNCPTSQISTDEQSLKFKKRRIRQMFFLLLLISVFLLINSWRAAYAKQVSEEIQTLSISVTSWISNHDLEETICECSDSGDMTCTTQPKDLPLNPTPWNFSGALPVTKFGNQLSYSSTGTCPWGSATCTDSLIGSVSGNSVSFVFNRRIDYVPGTYEIQTHHINGTLLSDTLIEGVDEPFELESHTEATCFSSDIAGNHASGTVQIIVNPGFSSADLTVEKLASESEVVQGEAFTYTLEIANSGPDTANNVIISDNLPPEVTPISYNCNENLTGQGWPGTVSYESLPSGNVLTCQINVQVNESAQDSITNSVSVASDGFDPDTGNNQDTIVTVVKDEIACVPDSVISNVILPQVTVPISIPNKPWQISYGELQVDFFAVDSSEDTICVVQSSAESMSVAIRGVRLGVPISPFLPFATSTASAKLSLYKDGAVDPPSLCDFSFVGGLNNNCLLNGSAIPDQSGHYVTWETQGFTIEAPMFRDDTGPLSFWVHLESMDLSPETHSLEEIIRQVEPFIHTRLIQDLPAISHITVIQDPGKVTLQVRDNMGQITGVLENGDLVTQIPASLYYPSPDNPGIFLGPPLGEKYEVFVTGIETGEFDLSAATIILPEGEVTEQHFQGLIAEDTTLVYEVILDTENDLALEMFVFKAALSIDLLIDYVENLSLNPGIKNSLVMKLVAAKNEIEKPNGSGTDAALNQLQAFKHEVEALSGTMIPQDVAQQLKDWSNSIETQILLNSNGKADGN